MADPTPEPVTSMRVPAELHTGGRVFTFMPLSAWAAFDLQPRLWPPVADVIAVLGSGTLPEDLEAADIGVLMPAVTAFFRHFKERGSFAALARELLAGATVSMPGGEKFPLDDPRGAALLMGQNMLLWRAVIHGVRFNFPDFFGALSKGRPKPGASPSPDSPA